MDDEHRRPAGVSDETIVALGKLSEAIEWLERARGRLFDFHQMVGHLDLQLGDAVELLRQAGHAAAAERVQREAVGRNVLDGRWTFQIIEEFDDLYYGPIRALEKALREELVQGRRHLHESELKEQRRTNGRSGHEHRPPDAHDQRVPTDRERVG
jgi:hypothetical protein